MLLMWIEDHARALQARERLERPARARERHVAHLRRGAAGDAEPRELVVDARTCRRRARRRSSANRPSTSSSSRARPGTYVSTPPVERSRNTRPVGLDVGAGARRGSAARRRRPRTTRPRARSRRSRAEPPGLERPPVDAAVLGEDRQDGIAVGQRPADLLAAVHPERRRRTRAAAAGPRCGRSPRRSAARRRPARRERRPRVRRRAPRAAGAGPARRWRGTTGPRAPRIAIDDCVRGRAPRPRGPPRRSGSGSSTAGSRRRRRSRGCERAPTDDRNRRCPPTRCTRRSRRA